MSGEGQVPCGRLKAVSLDRRFRPQLSNRQSAWVVAGASRHRRIQMMNLFLSKEVEHGSHRDPYQFYDCVNIVDLEFHFQEYPLLHEVRVLHLDKCMYIQEEP